jgi:hypothetical protein
MCADDIGAVQHERMTVTVISDTVNTASRLEALTKTCGMLRRACCDMPDRAHTGTGILVSAAALSEPERYASRFAGKFLVEGKREPLLLYEVFASAQHPRMRNAPLLARAIAVYHQAQIEEALAMFQSIVHLPISDDGSGGDERGPRSIGDHSSGDSSIDGEANEHIDGVAQLYIESCTQILRAGGAKRLPPNWQSVLSVTKGGRVLFDGDSMVRWLCSIVDVHTSDACACASQSALCD